MTGFHVGSGNFRRFSSLQSTVAKTSEAIGNDLYKQLVGSRLLVTFDGLGTENMTCLIDLGDNGESLFSGGVESFEKGFWRLVVPSSTSELPTLEIIHMITPEYMFFFDTAESKMLWSGKVDMVNRQVISGEVSAKKLRFNIFPYDDIVATFNTTIHLKGEPKPGIEIPEFYIGDFAAPPDFEDPGDIDKFPYLFAPDFVDWWYSVEDAMSRGETPPPRPKNYFVPQKRGTLTNGESAANEGRSSSRGRRKGFSNDRNNKQ